MCVLPVARVSTSFPHWIRFLPPGFTQTRLGKTCPPCRWHAWDLGNLPFSTSGCPTFLHAEICWLVRLCSAFPSGGALGVMTKGREPLWWRHVRLQHCKGFHAEWLLCLVKQVTEERGKPIEACSLSKPTQLVLLRQDRVMAKCHISQTLVLDRNGTRGNGRDVLHAGMLLHCARSIRAESAREHSISDLKTY